MKDQVAGQVEEFLKNGGKIQQCAEGEKSKNGNYYPSHLCGCKCGCEGNYTDHSMRLGERGIY